MYRAGTIHTARLRLCIGAVVLVAWTTVSRSVGAECPLNELSCGASSASGELLSASPRDSLGCSDPSAGAYGLYDLRTGLLGVSSSAYDVGAGMSGAVHDVYQIVGMEPGTPVSLVAEITAVGGVDLFGQCVFSPFGSFSATFFGDSGPSVSASGYASFGPPYCDGSGQERTEIVLQLPVAATAGQAFALHMEASTSVRWGSAHASLNNLAFSGLPPGASIVSCQGFLQEPPVQALQASWGRVKSIYR